MGTSYGVTILHISQGVGNFRRQAAVIGADSVLALVIEDLVYNGKAPAAPFLHAPAGCGLHLEICRVVSVHLAKNGFRIAGAIPTFVFLALEFYVCNLVAKKSYFKMEMNKLLKNAKKKNMTPYEYVSNRIPAAFWEQIESNIDKPEILYDYLEAMEKAKTISHSESVVIAEFSKSILGM